MDPLARNEAQLAAALRRFRRKAQLTQRDLAERTGKRQATISNLEGGSATLDTLFAVIKALELELVVRPRRKDRDLDLGDLF